MAVIRMTALRGLAPAHRCPSPTRLVPSVRKARGRSLWARRGAGSRAQRVLRYVCVERYMCGPPDPAQCC